MGKKITDLHTRKAKAFDKNNVTLRKDFIRCWTHANPTTTEEDASALYDALEERFPNMTRGGHRGMVGRLRPWESLVHECTACGKLAHGVFELKDKFGWRLVTWETKKYGTRQKYYMQPQCSVCRPLAPEKKNTSGKRINPHVDKYFTNRCSDAEQ